MIFSHTALERGMWRGWLPDGQVLEIAWGACGLGAGVKIHSQGEDAESFLWFGFGFVQFFIPTGMLANRWAVGDEPAWCLDLSREHGLHVEWGEWYRFFGWPLRTVQLAHEYLSADYSWKPHVSGERSDEYSRVYPYVYRLRSGEVQHRKATLTVERRTLGRNLLSAIYWPRRYREEICVKFDKEVGERSGTWKGGVVGCGYEMRDGEEPLDTLRRMERERTL